MLVSWYGAGLLCLPWCGIQHLPIVGRLGRCCGCAGRGRGGPGPTDTFSVDAAFRAPQFNPSSDPDTAGRTTRRQWVEQVYSDVKSMVRTGFVKSQLKHTEYLGKWLTSILMVTSKIRFKVSDKPKE